MRFFKNFLTYAAAPVLSLALFAIIFKIWNLDFSYPIFDRYSQDVLLHAFFVKTVVDSGWFMVNHLVGFPHITEPFLLYDFPLQASSFNFLIFKFFALFTSNPFTLLNLHFLLTFPLISFTSFVTLRALKISRFPAILVSVLYCFIFYHFYRSTNHALLTNYSSIPLIVLVAIWIMSRKIRLVGIDAENKFCLSANSLFYLATLVGIYAATNDAYYAIYACIIFIIAWFLAALKDGRFFGCDFFAVIAICAVILILMGLLYLPSFIYWNDHGLNSLVGVRTVADSESYALRIVDLFLPVHDHYIAIASAIKTFFAAEIYTYQNPMFGNERDAESLGLLGSAGCMFLMLWLLAKSFCAESPMLVRVVKNFSLCNEEEKILSDMASLNLVIILFATSGGLIMFMTPVFPVLRSHARFSTVIAFLSLFVVALIFDKLMQRNFSRKKIYVGAALSLLSLAAIFDQIGKSSSVFYRNAESHSNFISDRDFVSSVEAKMSRDARILILPMSHFPEGDYTSMAGYLHSKHLRWSYPVILGRKSANWQSEIALMNVSALIAEAKKKGFDAVMINRQAMVDALEKSATYGLKLPYGVKNLGWLGVREVEREIAKSAKSMSYSANKTFSFFELR